MTFRWEKRIRRWTNGLYNDSCEEGKLLQPANYGSVQPWWTSPLACEEINGICKLVENVRPCLSGGARTVYLVAMGSYLTHLAVCLACDRSRCDINGTEDIFNGHPSQHYINPQQCARWCIRSLTGQTSLNSFPEFQTITSTFCFTATHEAITKHREITLERSFTHEQGSFFPWTKFTHTLKITETRQDVL